MVSILFFTLIHKNVRIILARQLATRAKLFNHLNKDSHRFTI